MKRLILAGVVAMFGLYSFGDESRVKTSTASYYHDKFNGRKTASGEVFDNSDFTAANRKLAFGTRVKITNLRTNKSVVVRVNDRGPFVKGRAFDLSKAAFEEIGSLQRGVIPIKYEVIEN